jgi:anaerobic magnesium-protoporphyrin IX monomethyl ester cyclase
MGILLTTLNSKYIHSNLAIRLLFQLNKDIANLSWKEFTIKEPQDEIAEYCQNFEVVAFSVYIWNITPTLEVCKRIKTLNPSTKIMLGGPEVSYEYEPIIMLDYVDYIVVGEGEIPFNRFVQNFPAEENIPGIVSKKSGQIFYLPNTMEFELASLETINPYSDDNPSELSNKVLYVETSRGCPYKCEFCLASLDNKVRYLPMDRIKKNLDYLMRHGRVIKFLDRTFNVKKDFTIEVFQYILDHHRQGNIFQFEITADILHPDIIQYIKEKVPKGLFRFEIGIQTVNQVANLEVNRKQNFYKTKDVIDQVRDKIEMHLDLIVGLPFDYWKDVKNSIEEVFKIFPPELQLGFLKFLKGTPVRDKYAEHQYQFDPNPPYQIIESNYLSKEELYQITQLEFALEAYWNKKRLLHTLKYVTIHYSIFDFLLGLGIHFEKRSDYHKHTLLQLYEIAYEYLLQQFPDDIILQQLFAVDYYLQHKIKPKILFLEEMPRSKKNQLIETLQLNHHQFRYGVFTIDFDFETFKNIQEIKISKRPLIIQYSGTQTATVVTT